MKKNKKLKLLSLSLCLICLILYGNTSLAKTDNNISMQQNINLKQKELSKLNINDKNQIDKYYELKNSVIDMQINLKQNQEALKSAKEFVKTTQDLYGENSINAGYSYGKILSVCNSIGDIRGYKEYLDKLYKVIINNNCNDNCNELKYLYYRYKIGFYNTIEQPYESIGLLDMLKKYTDPKNQYDEYFYLNTVIYSQLNIKSYKNVLKDIYNYYYAFSKNKNATLNDYFDYYNTLMGYYNESSQYNKVPNVYLKALKLLKGNDNKTVQQKIYLNERYEKYFIEMNEFDKALDLIKENEKLALNLNDLNNTKQVYSLYKEYYDKKKNYNEEKKYIDKLYEVYKQLNSNDDERGYIDVYSEYLNYYKNINDYTKALKYAKKINKINSEIKDIMPVVYANSLKDMADIDTDNYSERLKIALEAKDIYKKYVPANSYNIFEIDKILVKIYTRMQEYEKGINQYEEAKKIIVNLAGKNHKNYIELNKDTIDLYNAKGDTQKALSLANETIEIAKQVYGNYNVAVYDILQKKADIYDAIGDNNKSQEIRNKISDDLDNSKVVGEDINVFYSNYNNSAWKKLEENDIENALKYAEKAELYAKSQWQKQDVRDIYKEIKKAQKN